MGLFTNKENNRETFKLLQYNNYNNINEKMVDALDTLYDEDKNFKPGKKFQDFIHKLFEMSDYTVLPTTHSHDKGIDLYVKSNKNNKECYMIQTKKRKLEEQKLFCSEDIRSFNGAVYEYPEYNKAKKVFITTHFFAKDAMDFAQKNNIELIDKIRLFQLIAQLQPQLLAKGYLKRYMGELGFCEKCGAPMVACYKYSKYYKCLDAINDSGCAAQSISEEDWQKQHNK